MCVRAMASLAPVGLDFEAHDDAGDCGDDEHQRHGDGHVPLMVDAPYKRQEGGGRGS